MHRIRPKHENHPGKTGKRHRYLGGNAECFIRLHGGHAAAAHQAAMFI
jgi:hypothetical protein